MIASLHIENIAVVKSLDVDMREGFTVLSGETGAGKSIIVDCLNLLGGARSDKGMIRTGEERGEVSAVFCNLGKMSTEVIEALGFSLEDGSIMLSRSIDSSSRSQARVNGRAVPLSVLREISAALFNIHGQNDNQRLLDKKNHIEILDTYADISGEVERYREVYLRLNETKRKIDSLKRDAMENNRMREMLKYQIEDIDALRIRVGEEAELVARSQRLQGLEKLKKQCALVNRAIHGSEKGIGALYLVERAVSALEQLSATIPEAEELARRLLEVKYEIDDVAASAVSLCDIDEEDPTSAIDKIESRLEAIAKLKRKYGADEQEILKFRADAAEKLNVIENYDEVLEELTASYGELESKARALATELRRKRRDAARRLASAIMETLDFLDMPKVTFEVLVAPSERYDAYGLDEVEFLISTNAGEPMMPLVKIASGGELARIMLSLKSVLNECDGIDTAIFDEIDIGISGKTSRKVGLKLREISRSSQVICVTHSAQIASLAASHLFVSKSEIDGRVQSELCELDRERRVEEIARILGGIEISELQRRTAREMIEEGERI